VAYQGLKVVCVLPAYNAAQTLEKTLREVPEGIVDTFILVDDASKDQTFQVAQALTNKYPLQIFKHESNLGYGGNQKTCYRKALELGADVVVMLHPDYQYEPRLLTPLVGMIGSGVYDICLGSRILGKGALVGGMPLYKYFFNRVLTLFENILIGQKLSEYHTGYRAFSKEVLKEVDFGSMSNDFVFDNQIIVQAHIQGFRIGEIAVPTKYFKEASSINFQRSVVYGLGVLVCSFYGLWARISGKKVTRDNLKSLSTKKSVT